MRREKKNHSKMDNLQLLAQAYRVFLLELGEAFKEVKESNGYIQKTFK